MRSKNTFVMIKAFSIIVSLLTALLWLYFYHKIREEKVKNFLSLRDCQVNEISKYRLVYNSKKKIFEKILDLDEEDIEVLTS
tara:strand:- start:9742 stop:9987 length:246 start_codon:yes stop_codon:yes gene_type:complete